MSGLYIHVPFCVSRCGYCDFVSSTDSGIRPAVIDALIHSVDTMDAAGVTGELSTIYIGGGTPTAAGDGLLRLVERAVALTGSGGISEFTVETNPDTTDPALIDALRSLGVTRFSLGVQSFDDRVLRSLGRAHDARTAHQALRVLTEAGCRVSIDLIAGIPGQSVATWRRDLEQAIESGVGHVSVYPLTLSDEAPLHGRMDPDDDIAADRLELASELLSAAGFDLYEIASFAREGERSLHNLSYWTGIDYLGIGPSASSMMTRRGFENLVDALAWGIEIPDGTYRVRFTADPDVHRWLDDPFAAPVEIEFLDEAEATREDLMLAFRTREGASPRVIDTAVNSNPALRAVLDDLEASGLIEAIPGAEGPGNDVTQRLVLSEEGWLLGNEVFGRVWNAE